MQSTTSLWRPFAVVSAAMAKETKGKFSKIVTAKGMRRTSKDLLRAAGVRDLVAMSINSHLDEGMHAHYSTVSAVETADALAKVVSLAGYRAAMGGK